MPFIMLVTIPKSVTTIKLKQYSLVVLSVCLSSSLVNTKIDIHCYCEELRVASSTETEFLATET